jgi:hypothetical protein
LLCFCSEVDPRWLFEVARVRDNVKKSTASK